MSIIERMPDGTFRVVSRYVPPAKRYWVVHHGCAVVVGLLVYSGHGDKARNIGQGWTREQIEEWAATAEAHNINPQTVSARYPWGKRST